MIGFRRVSGLVLLFSFLPSVAFGFGSKPAPAPSTPVTPAPSPGIPSPGNGNNFTSCLNQLSGSWNFGTAPSACNVSPAQSTAFVKGQYSPVLFRDGAATARTDYMSELYPVARELGTYYIKRRNPNVSGAELNGFLAGFYALLNQESFWTHYRLGTDALVRYMRGDSLHGYGIMQVDDRSHSVAIGQGKGVDLIDNMIYGLDIYYSAWVKSASASCVSSSSNYEERARSAWAAYNGGSGSICRWTNPNSAWAANDNGYITKFRARAWLGSVASLTKAAALDVNCMAEGARPCALK